jgi:hypothetical protein
MNKLSTYVVIVIYVILTSGCEEVPPDAQSSAGRTAPVSTVPSTFVGIWDTMIPTGGSSNYCSFDLSGVPHCDINPASPPAECAADPGIGGFTIYSSSLGLAFDSDEAISISGNEVTFATSAMTVGVYTNATLSDSVLVEVVPGCFRQYYYYNLP